MSTTDLLCKHGHERALHEATNNRGHKFCRECGRISYRRNRKTAAERHTLSEERRTARRKRLLEEIRAIEAKYATH